MLLIKTNWRLKSKQRQGLCPWSRMTNKILVKRACFILAIYHYWRIQGGAPGSSIFNFHAVFWGKLVKIIGWRPHLCGWRPLFWEILEPPLTMIGVEFRKRTAVLFLNSICCSHLHQKRVNRLVCFQNDIDKNSFVVWVLKSVPFDVISQTVFGTHLE